VLRQQFLVDARLVIETLGESLGSKSRKISIAFVVFRQKDQMEVRFLATDVTRRAIEPICRRDISLAPDDRLDAARLHRVVERDSAVHVAMIGHGARLHPEFFGAFGERFYLDCAVEETVISV
jgi:hypothetical protein